MNLFDQENMLSGVATEIMSDYNSGYDTSLFGTTDSIAIIGTAFNGPVGKPIEIYSPEHAKYVFGSSYDSKTRKEATLVASIQDAWDRGCRTIYAVRISGKTLSKDYQLIADTNLKLRVSGIFPSNSNKDVYMSYCDKSENMSVEIFKPAKRATINEKKQGMVENQEAVLVNKIDISAGGMSKNDELIEFIKRVNNYPYNNVIRLSIVDEKGNDVTLSSLDAKALKLGDIFPGIYTVGRIANAKNVVADTKLDIVMNKKPYEEFEGNIYKELILNTNIAKDLPIYSKNADLHILLKISSINELDFLEVAGKIDEVFLKDKIDYEEVSINDFDLYNKLGSGFAVNASVVELTDTDNKPTGIFKVREVTDKSKKKSEIKDGMYSMLENLTSKYRVLCGVSADTVIKGKLPKADQFKFAKTNSVSMFNEAIKISSIVDKKDLTQAKEYEIIFDALSDNDLVKLDSVKDSLYNKRTIRQATLMTKVEMDKAITDKNKYAEGSLFLVTGISNLNTYAESDITMLYTFANNEFKCLHDSYRDSEEEKDHLFNQLIFANGALFICNKSVGVSDQNTLKYNTFAPAVATDIDSKKFAILCLDNGTFVILEVTSVIDNQDDNVLISENGITAEILGTVETVLNEEDDKLIFSLSTSYEKNVIKIRSNQFDYVTIFEIAELLNEDKDFSKLFEIKITNTTNAQEFITDISGSAGILLTAELIDREVTYDTNLLLPFRTEDNFGRHLAQHCTYTSLKTSPTHGIMGTKILLDMGLDSIANRVKDLVGLRLDTQLVVKKSNGTDLLDKNNMPYPIGRKLSVIVGQYQVTTPDNYTFISNMAAGYAGMISCLPLDQSSTCQPINVPGQMYEFTNYQLSSLTGAGFITVKKSYSKGWVITDGITMATSESPYRRLSSTRIADGLEDIIRRVCEPYIGKQNHIANQNSLRSAIKSELDKLKDKLIENYDFKLLVDKASAKLGIINIEYSVVPIYEIKIINNSIKITG